jgi:hypothetical protein
MLSLRGNVWDGGIPLDDTKTLRRVVKGGNLPQKEKKRNNENAEQNRERRREAKTAGG